MDKDDTLSGRHRKTVTESTSKWLMSWYLAGLSSGLELHFASGERWKPGAGQHVFPGDIPCCRQAWVFSFPSSGRLDHKRWILPAESFPRERAPLSMA